MSETMDSMDAVTAVTEGGYKFGFSTDIEMEMAPLGLNEDIIRLISSKKNEPDWLLEWRLKAYQTWLGMEEPHWAMLHHDLIDYQALH